MIHNQCSEGSTCFCSSLLLLPSSLQPCPLNFIKVTTASIDANSLVHWSTGPHLHLAHRGCTLFLPEALCDLWDPTPTCSPPPAPFCPCDLIHDTKHPRVLRTPTYSPPPRQHDPWFPSLFLVTHRHLTVEPFRSDHWTHSPHSACPPSVHGHLPPPATQAKLLPQTFPTRPPWDPSATPGDSAPKQLGATHYSLLRQHPAQPLPSRTTAASPTQPLSPLAARGRFSKARTLSQLPKLLSCL